MINLILAIGILGVVASTAFKYLIKYLPQIIPYRTALQLVSVIILVFGVYLKGGQVTEEKWRARVAEMEKKVADAEQKAKDANKNIQTVYLDKIKVVKEKQIVVQEKIKTVEVMVDSQCKITPESVDVLNEAAKGK